MLRPKQKVSRAEKNKDWYEQNALWANKISTRSTVDNRHIEDLYHIVTGQINVMSYRHVTNPYGDSSRRNYPAKLINYDIISPMIMQILSEFVKRLYQPNVYAKNTEIDTIREQYEIEEFTKILQQDFVNFYIKAGKYVPGQTDENGQPIEEPQHPDLVKKKKMTIRDVKASEGQNMLEYILTINNADAIWRKCMFDFIVTNQTYTRRGFRYDEVIYRYVRPQCLSFYASTHVDFIEDAEVVRYTDRYTLNEIVDMLTGLDGFTPEIIDLLETSNLGSGATGGFFESFSRNFYGEDTHKITDSKMYILSHVQWTAYDYIGRLKTVDLFGKPDYIEVDDTYVETVGDDIEWRWCACTYEAYVLQNKFVIGAGRVETSRAKYNTPHVNKKCYNGKIYMYHTGVKFDSLAEKLYAYQELYNIMKFKLQYTINKNKDKLAVIPIGLLGHFKDEEDSIIEYDAIEGKNTSVPIKNKEESSIAKALYYADTTQMLFVDESSPNAQMAINMLKNIDLSLGNYMGVIINYCNSIKEEAGELIGFNRYRRADINTNDRVSNVETAQYTGSLIIEEYFTAMKELQDCDCQALLDYGNIAYREGKKASFIRSDGEQVIFNLEPYSIENAEFGVFAKDSGSEKRKLDELKQFGLTLSQNSGLQAPIVRMLASDGNLNKIVTDIESMEDEIYRREQEKQQNDMQMNQAQIQAEQARYDADMKFKYYKVDEDNRVKIETHYSSLLNGGNNDIEIIKLKQQAIKDQQEAALAQQKLLLENKGLDIKAQDSANKVKIAKVNPS